MGRKSKLSDLQWTQAKKMAVEGKSAGDIAKHFGVARSTISEGISDAVTEIKTVAAQALQAEEALTRLPISDQLLTVNLLSSLRSMSVNMAKGGELGAKNYFRLNVMANAELQKIDDADPMASQDALKGVAVLTKMANDAAATPIALLSANKDRVQKLDDAPDADAAPTSGVLKVPGMSMTALAWSAAVTGKDQPTETSE